MDINDHMDDFPQSLKRIAIVYCHRNFDSVPSLCSTVELLADCGYRIDIFTLLDGAFLRPLFPQNGVSVLPLTGPERAERAGMWRLVPEERFFPLWLRWRSRQVPYRCVIGADPEGLVRAADMAGWLNIPYAYYSLELLLSYELQSDEQRALKAREKVLSQRAAFVIIQDEERAGLLMGDNAVSRDRIICVPNAPLGRATRSRSTYLRDMFGVRPDQRIILNTGTLSTWTCTHQLALSTREWPDNWVLICHTRSRGWSLNREYMIVLKDLSPPGRIRFSTAPVPRCEYPRLIQSADVGVAFYGIEDDSVFVQDNIRFIGLSSGKVAYYLQAGLPVLVNDIQSHKRLVSEYGCGQVAQDPSVTRPALERIFINYDTYSRNALRCFAGEYDFTGKFEAVIRAVEALEKGSGARR